jgi:hypothetical protein
MNVTFGLLPPFSTPLRGKAKKEIMARRAVADMEAWAKEIGEGDESLGSVHPSNTASAR